MGLGQDLGRGAGLDELGQHLAPQMAGVLDLAVELAVGKGARPALAELHIALGIERAPAPQAPGILGPLAHDLAAVEDDRPQPHLRQDQTGEQAAGSRADHHRPRPAPAPGRGGDEFVVGVGRRPHMRVVGEAGQHGGLVLERRVHRIDHGDRRLLAGVIAPSGDGEGQDVGGGDEEPRRQRRRQRLGRMAQRQFQIGNAQHGGGCSGGGGAGQPAPAPNTAHPGECRDERKKSTCLKMLG